MNEVKSSSASGKPVCCILGASFGTRNLGVSALAASAVASILQAFPDARIFLLDYARTPATFQVKHRQGSAEVELVNLRFSWKIFLRNNIARLIATALLLRLIPIRSLRERWIAKNPWLKKVQEADLIGSLAGGDSFSDIYGLRRFWYVSLPQLLVLALGKRLTLLPQTLGPFKGLTARTVAGFILRQAERVYTRDREGAEEVRPLMGRYGSKLVFSYDLAFLLEPIAPEQKPAWSELASSHTLVGINVSGLLYRGGYSQKNMFGLCADYPELIRKLIEYFIDRQGAHVVLVPHVFGSPGDLESDPAAGAEIYRELEARYRGRLHLITEEYDQHEIKYLIGQCHFFLGSRMHACIAALSQGVPAISLAYSKKFLGVLRTIGAEKLVIDLREHSVERIVALTEAAYATREEIRADLRQRMPAVRKSVSDLLARDDRSNETAASALVPNLVIPPQSPRRV
jgi:colanic acid/amylovoran biosynthesis protein WcaK/AmsJ